ncbi:hypothetical protein AQPE_1334 [Aquipluma nitroreducens]|uniref:Uncharacterized protein n=1 Tax=Aquipluma nitroreducens TaxID=2010828 RepID=A0A5K7S6T3_9BACT|nr:hypothetical protein AQPE_1334 [Aquipluma nitroreducens]
MGTSSPAKVSFSGSLTEVNKWVPNESGSWLREFEHAVNGNIHKTGSALISL